MLLLLLLCQHSSSCGYMFLCVCVNLIHILSVHEARPPMLRRVAIDSNHAKAFGQASNYPQKSEPEIDGSHVFVPVSTSWIYRQAPAEPCLDELVRWRLGSAPYFCSRDGCNKLRLAHRRTCSCRSRAHQSSLCGYPARCEVATLLASERVALAPELQVVPAEVLPQEAGAVAAVAQGRHRRNHCYRHRVGPMHLRCLQARLPKNHHWLRLSRRHLHRPLVVAVAVVVVVAECCCCKYAAAAATTAAATNKQQIKQHKSKHKQQLNSNINYFNAHRLARLKAGYKTSAPPLSQRI